MAKDFLNPVSWQTSCTPEKPRLSQVPPNGIPFSRLPFCLDFSSTFEINTCQISAVLQGSLTQDTQRRIAAFFSLGDSPAPPPLQPLGKNCQNNGQPHTDTPKAHFQSLWPLTLLNIPRLWSTYETTSGGQLATCSTQETNALKIGVETHASPICRAYALC